MSLWFEFNALALYVSAATAATMATMATIATEYVYCYVVSQWLWFVKKRNLRHHLMLQTPGDERVNSYSGPLMQTNHTRNFNNLLIFDYIFLFNFAVVIFHHVYLSATLSSVMSIRNGCCVYWFTFITDRYIYCGAIPDPFLCTEFWFLPLLLPCSLLTASSIACASYSIRICPPNVTKKMDF